MSTSTDDDDDILTRPKERPREEPEYVIKPEAPRIEPDMGEPGQRINREPEEE